MRLRAGSLDGDAMSTLSRIASDPWSALRRFAIAAGLAAVIVFIGGLTIAYADGPVWLIYALALATCGAAVMQTLLPGAGLRVPRRSRDDDEDDEALIAAAVAWWQTATQTSERTERLFEPPEQKRDPLTAFRRAAFQAIAVQRGRTEETLAAWAHTTSADTERGEEQNDALVRYLRDNPGMANIVTTQVVLRSMRELDDDTRAELKRHLLEAFAHSEAAPVEHPLAKQEHAEQR